MPVRSVSRNENATVAGAVGGCQAETGIAAASGRFLVATRCWAAPQNSVPTRLLLFS